MAASQAPWRRNAGMWLIGTVLVIVGPIAAGSEDCTAAPFEPLVQLTTGADVSRALLNDTVVHMPALGFGTAFWRDCESGSTCQNEVDNEGWEYHGCVSCLREALEAGYRHFDLAELYDGAEEAFQSAWKSVSIDALDLQREDMFLVSKASPTEDEDDEMYTFAGVIQSFNRSLLTLGTDYLDLYLLHWHAPGWQAAWRALETLHVEGRVRAIGVSNFGLLQLEAMLSEPLLVRPAVVQNFVDLRHQFRGLRAWCARHGIAYVAYSTLSFFATGARYGSAREVLQRIASSHGVSPQQVSLKWALQEGLAVIPKTRQKSRMLENLQSLRFELSSAELAELVALDAPLTAPPSSECKLVDDLVVC